MEMLETAVIIVHVLVSLALVALVLLQQGKGAEAGASFGGGASQTVFGSAGSGNFLTRSTSTLAVIFFVTSITLAIIAKQKAEVAASGQDQILVPVEQTAPAAFQEPVFENDGQPVDYNQSMDDLKAEMEQAMEAGMSSFAGQDEAGADEGSSEQLPELE
ncbi:MAG: preprotein translocase subunit SecG [Oleiphilus sp.]|nr:MAG: preprotein translocase subunit SecG [Oleiphilus sp.]